MPQIFRILKNISQPYAHAKKIVYAAILFGILSIAATAGTGSGDEASGATTVVARLSSSAIAPLPAFSLSQPAIAGYIASEKGNFKYEGDLSLGTDGKPLMWNNWFRYNLLQEKEWALGMAAKVSLGFYPVEMPDKDGAKGSHRTIAGELFARVAHSPKMQSSLTYRYSLSPEVLYFNGHYFDASTEFREAFTYRGFSLNPKAHAFYFNNKGTTEGMYVGATLSVRHTDYPAMLTYQGFLPVSGSVIPGSDFRSCFSLAYFFW